MTNEIEGAAVPSTESAEKVEKQVPESPSQTVEKLPSAQPDVSKMSPLEIYRYVKGLNRKSEVPTAEVGTKSEDDKKANLPEKNDGGGDEPTEDPEEDLTKASQDENGGAEDKELEGSPKRALKRIDTLTAQLREAQKKLKEYEEKGGDSRETESMGVSSSVEDLRKEAKVLQEAVGELESLTIRKPKIDESGEEYWEVQGRKLGRDQISDLLRQFKKRLNVELPAEYERSISHNKLCEEAEKTLMSSHSWYKDPGSSLRQDLDQIRKNPRYKKIFSEFGEASLVFAGYLENEARKQAEANKKTPVKVPPKPLVPVASLGTSETVSEKLLAQAESLKRKAESTGRREDIVAFMSFVSKNKLNVKN